VRELNDLRISLTDRCNLRCVYCMPEEGIDFRPPEELLRDDELLLLVRIAAELGVKRVRLTGGEPTVRPAGVDLVGAIGAVPGIRDLSMTTNGILLEYLAADLARAGLRRGNVSLDTLDPEKFGRITRGGRVELGVADGAVRCAGALAAVTFLDQQGRVRAAVHGPEASYRPAGDEGFIRVEARDRAGGRVWSQPFRIEKEGLGA
jgi:molybdenum cofactor biosynthesis enzyme MoaA